MVRGLTTFINKRSYVYMENYQLHNTKLILDGDSISYELYASYSSPRNSGFNGDYDRYANLVRNFFNTLRECNITPYILYDGGYEDRRMGTILDRMQVRIDTAAKINPNSNDLFFPLCIVETFKNVADEFNIEVICCDYECDLECAKIANYLNCPLLSHDSDFFIFDVNYIPFNTLNLRTMTCLKMINNQKQTYKYLSCKIFNRDKFLETLNLKKDMLPLFAVLLGNDYINRETFSCIYKQFKGAGPIHIIAGFLLNKTKEAVIKEIVTICNFTDKDDIIKNIYTSIDGYAINKNERSKYMKYLKSENLELESDGTIDKDDIDFYMKNTSASLEMIPLFIDNFRKGMYPSYFINILFYNVYHIRPQIEDISKPSAHLVNMELISAIHRILRPSSEQLQFYTRFNLKHNEHLVPLCNISDVPNFIDIKNIDRNSRQQILLQVTDLDKNFVDNCLNIFPESWKIFIIAIYYFYNKSNFTWSFIYSLLLCKIVIKYVDTKLEKFIRDPKSFFDNYKDDVFQLLLNKKDSSDLKHTIQDAVESITHEDSLLALKNVIHFFEAQSELSNNVQLFDKSLVHSLAEFQSCLCHINHLNSLLNVPFDICKMMNCFNGTFIYNVTIEIRKHSENYIQDLLQKSPTILNCYNLIIENLQEHIEMHF